MDWGGRLSKWCMAMSSDRSCKNEMYFLKSMCKKKKRKEIRKTTTT
jgi:hypothetical protein